MSIITVVAYMDMVDEELRRLGIRLDELTEKVIPDFENRTQILYARILSLKQDSEVRTKLENEYRLLSKELSMRSDELIKTRHQIDNLTLEKNGNRKGHTPNRDIR